MPNSCCAGYCTNTNIKGYQICRFPKDSERKRIWIPEYESYKLDSNFRCKIM